MFALADRLHQPLSVVMAMTVEEFHGWLAWHKLMKDEADGH